MSVCILALLAAIGARLARGGRVKTSRGLEESKRRRVIFRGEGGGRPGNLLFWTEKRGVDWNGPTDKDDRVRSTFGIGSLAGGILNGECARPLSRLILGRIVHFRLEYVSPSEIFRSRAELFSVQQL